MIEAYPLCWPVARPRARFREAANFRTAIGRARDEVRHQVKLLGGAQLVMSTNLMLRQDGLPYANQRQPDDPGVAIYFTYKKRQMCFACDRWRKIEDNLQAVAKTIEALRGVARWGTGDMMEAAFTGFTALPAPGQTTLGWREVLEVPTTATKDEIELAYKRLRSKHHPDKQGDAVMFNVVQKAYEQARQELLA